MFCMCTVQTWPISMCVYLWMLKTKKIVHAYSCQFYCDIDRDFSAIYIVSAVKSISCWKSTFSDAYIRSVHAKCTNWLIQKFLCSRIPKAFGTYGLIHTKVRICVFLLLLAYICFLFYICLSITEIKTNKSKERLEFKLKW